MSLAAPGGRTFSDGSSSHSVSARRRSGSGTSHGRSLTPLAPSAGRSVPQGFRVEATCELAMTLARAGDPAAAYRLAEEARPLAAALGMTPWLARLAALAPGTYNDPLTARERQIAGLVAEGLSNRGIADRLVISERTAQNHVQHILVKLGFSSRAQIAAWATQRRA
jgi:DNA-binding NarL/FixJ family response regulator